MRQLEANAFPRWRSRTSKGTIWCVGPWFEALCPTIYSLFQNVNPVKSAGYKMVLFLLRIMFKMAVEKRLLM
ncbi:MAG TPA: hypothetical protein VK435_07395 [Thermodesulfovibrionales bacterium]|nr:hypothetical protein [Thermodesulfovibrionales bacterium]